MKKLQLYKLFLLVLFLPVQLFAQDITGLWKGEMYVDSTKKYLPYEISISEVKGKLIGYSLITFEENGKQETGLRDITIDRKDDKIIIEDVSLIDNSFSFVPPKNIKKTMIVFLTVGDTIMKLNGYWSTNRTKHYLSATGSVELHRKNDYRATVLYKKLEVLKLADKVVFNEPEKKSEPVMAIVPPTAPPVTIVTKPVDEKKTPPAAVKEAAPAATVAVVSTKSVEEKKVASTTIKETPPASTPIVATKTAEVKAPPPVVKPAIPKTVAPPVAVVSKPVEEKKTAPVVSKPAPPPPVVAPVIVAKPKEIVVVVEKKPEPVILPNAATGAVDVNKRTITTTQSVFYKSDSLVLTLYDNGYVDGDTVSVVMNGEVIFSKQGLSTKAVSKTIYITKETPDSIKLVMYAENLGSIPPNTGLLVVHDGEAVYDVRFSADLKSNAAIILTRKKKE
jgi:hypothetical protein